MEGFALSSLLERAVELLDTHQWETEWQTIGGERVPINVCGDCGSQEGAGHTKTCEIQQFLSDAAAPREMVIYLTQPDIHRWSWAWRRNDGRNLHPVGFNFDSKELALADVRRVAESLGLTLRIET